MVDDGLLSHVGVVAVSHVQVLREAVQTLHVLVAQMQQSQTLISYSAHQAVHVSLWSRSTFDSQYSQAHLHEVAWLYFIPKEYESDQIK